MKTARPRRSRAWKVGATVALTVLSSGFVGALAATPASADVICEEDQVYTVGTGWVAGPGGCFDIGTLPYGCSHPDDEFQPWVGVKGNICVID
jgi:hypothetical protein